MIIWNHNSDDYDNNRKDLLLAEKEKRERGRWFFFVFFSVTILYFCSLEFVFVEIVFVFANLGWMTLREERGVEKEGTSWRSGRNRETGNRCLSSLRCWTICWPRWWPRWWPICWPRSWPRWWPRWWLRCSPNVDQDVNIDVDLNIDHAVAKDAKWDSSLFVILLDRSLSPQIQRVRQKMRKGKKKRENEKQIMLK